MSDDNKNKRQFMKESYTKEEVKIICWRFVVGILLLVIVWLLTASDNKNFVDRFGFAATISSIILSVLAIFVSISGESKLQNIRDRMLREVDDMEQVNREIKASIDSLSD